MDCFVREQQYIEAMMLYDHLDCCVSTGVLYGVLNRAYAVNEE